MRISRRGILASGLGAASLPLLASVASAEQEDPKIPEGAIVLVAELKVKPGMEEVVKKALLKMVVATRKEKGCICYNLHQSTKDKTLFAFYEQWTDQAAFDAHGDSPHMAAMRKAIAGKTDKGGGVTFYNYLQ